MNRANVDRLEGLVRGLRKKREVRISRVDAALLLLIWPERVGRDFNLMVRGYDLDDHKAWVGADPADCNVDDLRTIATDPQYTAFALWRI